MPLGEVNVNAAQAENMVTGQADRILCISQADGAWLNPKPRSQEGWSALKQESGTWEGKKKSFRIRNLADP